MMELAHQVVRDGEGATKPVEVRVTGASDAADAHRVAMSIARIHRWSRPPSPGRTPTGAGSSRQSWQVRGTGGPRPRVDPVRRPSVAEKGWRVPDYSEEAASAYMRNQDLLIHVDLGLGKAAKSVRPAI